MCIIHTGLNQGFSLDSNKRLIIADLDLAGASAATSTAHLPTAQHLQQSRPLIKKTPAQWILLSPGSITSMRHEQHIHHIKNKDAGMQAFRELQRMQIGKVFTFKRPGNQSMNYFFLKKNYEHVTREEGQRFVAGLKSHNVTLTHYQHQLMNTRNKHAMEAVKLFQIAEADEEEVTAKDSMTCSATHRTNTCSATHRTNACCPAHHTKCCYSAHIR
ncbi:PREDICTED: uncharacterized protein LOC106809799 isoform X2 [Priapulus caudatus]|uniref:Uncharacterized protein LOC106809799 isoform X2 n=1 Tax=Priapulus caudatus TaxID=37621 RepID=A0ABM1E8H0_PRICU|nr:PREDICTED: uncharacterized protein LOC106809799 isoform X2 [Priapulus caudatus]